MAKGKVITVAQQKGGSGKTTLAVNLGVMLVRAGHSVAFLDTDPQGSLGRWFMTRHEAGRANGMEFSTSSAWGVGYEVGKLRDMADFVIIDTPPKADSDLRPALRAADLVLVPIASSHVDLWATDGVLDLARREGREVLLVLNRARAGPSWAQKFRKPPKGWPPILPKRRSPTAWPMRPALVKAWVPPKVPRTPPCAQSWKPCWPKSRARWMRADTAASANRQT